MGRWGTVSPPSPVGAESLNPRNRGHCPGTNTKCCSEDAPSKSSSSLPSFDNLFASSDLSSVGSNTLLPVGDLAFNPDDNNNNLFTSSDGSTFNQDLSAFNPDDSSQISYGLTGPNLLGDEGTTLVGVNGDSDQTDLFASAGGDESSLDLFS